MLYQEEKLHGGVESKSEVFESRDDESAKCRVTERQANGSLRLSENVGLLRGNFKLYREVE